MRLLVEEFIQKETELLNEFIEKINTDENLRKNKVSIKIENPYAAYLKNYIVLMGNHDRKTARLDEYWKVAEEENKQ